MRDAKDELYDALTLLLGRSRFAELAVENVTADELRTALREHARATHPDRAMHRTADLGEATRRFQAVTAAYDRVREVLPDCAQGATPPASSPAGPASGGPAGAGAASARARAAEPSGVRPTAAGSAKGQGPARGEALTKSGSVPPPPRAAGDVTPLAESLRRAGQVEPLAPSLFSELRAGLPQLG